MRAQAPDSGRFVLLVVAVALAAATPARAQVAAEIELRDSVATILVRNPSAQVMTVEVALHHGEVVEGRLELGEPVDAILGPREFRLQAGGVQTVRALVRERVEPGTVLRIVTTLTPEPGVAAEGRGPRGRVVLATRLITRLVAR